MDAGTRQVNRLRISYEYDHECETFLHEQAMRLPAHHWRERNRPGTAVLEVEKTLCAYLFPLKGTLPARERGQRTHTCALAGMPVFSGAP